jgi:protein kinase A
MLGASDLKSDIKKMAAGLLHPHQHNHSQHSSPPSTSPVATPDRARQEKQFVAQFCEHPVLPPDEIQEHPRNKELGGSSKALSVRDFELVRTLGTGASRISASCPSCRRARRCQSRHRLLMRVLRV